MTGAMVEQSDLPLRQRLKLFTPLMAFLAVYVHNLPPPLS